MKKRFIFGLVLLFLLSCNKDDSNVGSIKQQNGNFWIAIDLAVCAQQLHLDNGDVLIINLEDTTSLKSGDRVNVKYKEIGKNHSCKWGIDCEIIDIRKIQ